MPHEVEMQKQDLAAERATTEELQNQRVKMQDEMEALRGQILAVDLSKEEALMQRNFYKNESESHAKAIAQLQQKIPVIEAELKQACEKKLNDTNATWKKKLTEKDAHFIAQVQRVEEARKVSWFHMHILLLPV